MSSMQLEALILRNYPYGENDCIYRILTPTLGKISAIAKSVKKSKKRFSSFPEPFDLGVAEIRKGRGELFLFNGFIPKRTLLPLRESLERFSTACVLCESFDGLIHEESSLDHMSDLFHAASDGLYAISNSASDDPISHYGPANHALRKLLRLTGFLEERQLDSSLSPTEEWQWVITRIETVLDRRLATCPRA